VLTISFSAKASTADVISSHRITPGFRSNALQTAIMIESGPVSTYQVSLTADTQLWKSVCRYITLQWLLSAFPRQIISLLARLTASEDLAATYSQHHEACTDQSHCQPAIIIFSECMWIKDVIVMGRRQGCDGPWPIIQRNDINLTRQHHHFSA